VRIKQFKHEVPMGMFIKKHYCPECSAVLKIKKVKRIVNSRSAEAKDFDFSAVAGPYHLDGDVEFIWHVYYCANCDIEITNIDMRKFERDVKKGKWNAGYLEWKSLQQPTTAKRKEGSSRELAIFIILSIVFLSLYYYIFSK